MTGEQAPPWRVEASEDLLRNPWFGVLHQQVRGPTGRLHDYFTVDFAGPAVGVVARRNEQYLLIRQYRFIVDEYVWAIPSGGVEAGETPSQAARRELREETGHDAAALRHIFGYYPSYGATNQRFELFLAEDVAPVEGGPDPGEVLGLGWFSRAQIVRMVLEGAIVDGLSLTPLAVLLLGEDVGAVHPPAPGGARCSREPWPVVPWSPRSLRRCASQGCCAPQWPAGPPVTRSSCGTVLPRPGCASSWPGSASTAPWW